MCNSLYAPTRTCMDFVLCPTKTSRVRSREDHQQRAPVPPHVRGRIDKELLYIHSVQETCVSSSLYTRAKLIVYEVDCYSCALLRRLRGVTQGVWSFVPQKKEKKGCVMWAVHVCCCAIFRLQIWSKRVWCTTQLAKLSFNHSHGRTHSWRFSTFYKIECLRKYVFKNVPAFRIKN